MNKKRKKILFIILRSVLIVLFILVALWLNAFGFKGLVFEQYVQNFGYIGLFLASAVSGFNIFVPIPVIAFFPFLTAAGLHPYAIILVVSLGMALGDLFGYVLGRAGRDMFTEKKQKKIKKMTARLEKLQEKHELLPAVFLFFYAALVPLPNELVIIPMGFFRFRVVVIFIAVFFGNIIFNTLFAFGFTHLPNLF
jgi:membrane protein YqaA with SNARE-associated domain